MSGYVLLTIAVGIVLMIYQRKRSRQSAEMFRMIQEYQLRALNARISPHFLQNVFNFLADQYDKVDKETIARTLTSLSSLLRQMIVNIERRLIPLEDELDFTEQYLALKKMVFFDKFTYSVDVEESIDTFGIDVPAMLIQPIVENSIKHGFRNIVTGGIISVSVHQADGYVVCEIRDNGQGAADDQEKGRPQGQTWLDMTNSRMGISYAGYVHKPKVIVKSLQPGRLTQLYIPLD